MIKILATLIGWIVNLWSKIPDSEKDKIIVIIVESFDKMLRSYYKRGNQEAPL